MPPGSASLPMISCLAAPVSAQPATPREGQCLDPSISPEIYGPTDINAQSANQSMAVAVNRVGTVTVLRWPRPSFYDQVKEHTTGRDRAPAGHGSGATNPTYVSFARASAQ